MGSNPQEKLPLKKEEKRVKSREAVTNIYKERGGGQWGRGEKEREKQILEDKI